MSIKQEPSQDLTQQLAERLRTLRRSEGLTLDQLAQTSGVSRSMISLVERGEVAATAVVLERLATALGQTLAGLFDAPVAVAASRAGAARRATPAATPNPVTRRADQPLWQDPASGYRRRNVSSATVPQPFQIVEVHFPPRARVAFETGAREHAAPQQVWVLEGRIDVTVGDASHRLDEGDCLAMTLGQPTMFHNPARRPARYVVVLGRDPFLSHPPKSQRRR